jgi:peptide-methionine (S)-S-oxide reductase
MRKKYRSAIYYFNEEERELILAILKRFQSKFDNQLITQVLSFVSFKPSGNEIQNYYYKNPVKPFCTSFISPKLKLLLSSFSIFTDTEKLKHLNIE